jgi:hypothetical protein
MTATKANAGGVAGAVVVIANWLLTLVPGWMAVPDEPRGAITFLVSSGIVWLAVYLAPANEHTLPPVPATAPDA